MSSPPEGKTKNCVGWQLEKLNKITKKEIRRERHAKPILAMGWDKTSNPTFSCGITQ